MVHLQHVHAHVGHDVQQSGQGFGLIRQHRGEVGGAPGLGQAPGDDPLQHGHVHIAAGQQGAHGLAPQVHLAVHGGGDAHGSRALGHQLLLLQHRQDGPGDLVFADGHHLVHILAAHFKGQVPGGFHLDAVGDGVHAGQGQNMPGLQGVHHAGGSGGLYADDLAGGLQMLHGIGQTRDQSAAADGHQDHVHIRQLLQNLQTDGALTGHDPIVVKGMDKGQPLLIPQAHGLGIGVVIHAVHQHHVGPIAAGGLDLGDRSPGGDADGGGDLHIPGGKAHALGMVACGAGDNAPALLLVGQGGDLIVRAPQLEGPRLLQAVRLQIKVAVRHQARRVQHRGLVDNGGQHPACVLEHFHRDHIVASLILFYIQNPIFCSYAMYYHDTLSRRDCQFLFGQRAAFFAI